VKHDGIVNFIGGILDGGDIASPPVIDPPRGVPEPATLALFGVALAGLAGAFRKKKLA
jgi:hypothetical protein